MQYTYCIIQHVLHCLKCPKPNSSQLHMKETSTAEKYVSSFIWNFTVADQESAQVPTSEIRVACWAAPQPSSRCHESVTGVNSAQGSFEPWRFENTKSRGDLVKQTSYRKEQNSWNIWFCLILIPPSDIRVPRFGNSREHWSLLRIFCIVPHGVIPLGIWARNLLPRIHIFNPKSPLLRLILIHFEIKKWWTNWNSSKLCVEANHLWPVHLRGIDYAMFDKLGAGRCNWVAAPILSLDPLTLGSWNAGILGGFHVVQEPLMPLFFGGQEAACLFFS